MFIRNNIKLLGAGRGECAYPSIPPPQRIGLVSALTTGKQSNTGIVKLSFNKPTIFSEHHSKFFKTLNVLFSVQLGTGDHLQSRARVMGFLHACQRLEDGNPACST